MSYTYILKSKASEKHYFGHTSNVEKRFAEHNLGLSTYTKKFIPCNLIYFEEFDSRTEAMLREIFFKTLSGYHWLKNNGIIQSLQDETNPSGTKPSYG